MGLTDQLTQREEISAALETMTWTDDVSAQLDHLDGPAVRAIVSAVFHYRRDQLRLIGTAALPGGRQLVGLQHADGTRSYVLDLDAEAIHILAEIPRPVRRDRVA